MTKRLARLRVARVAAIRDEWLSVGLSTERSDRPAAEAGVRLAYGAAGLQPPLSCVWLDSPWQGTQVAARLAADAAEGEASVGALVRDRVRAQVAAQVGARVAAYIRAQVWGQVGAEVWSEVGAHVQAQLEALARVHADAQIGAQLQAQIETACYGQHDAGWLGFYAALGECGALVNPLAGLMQVARAAGWWWPFRHTAVLTERPTVLRRDSEHRLHCADGPDLQYLDGWSAWTWHGVRVPSQVVTAPHTLTAAAITAERDVEVRRVMLERYGEERYLRESQAAPIHRDARGELWRAELADDEPLVMVRVVDGTPEPDGSHRDYWLRVPPTMKTAREAVAWTFGKRPASYAPLRET
jgi:hypothetical protein